MENTITNIAKGVGIALLASLILLLVFAIVLTYTNVSENIWFIKWCFNRTDYIFLQFI